MATITVGGQTRELKYTWPALEKGAQWIGAPFYGWDVRDPRVLRCALAAGLLHEDRKLTPERLSESLDLGEMTSYISAVAEAMAEALPKSEESEPGEAKGGA